MYATEQIKDSLVYNGKGYLIENQFLFEEELMAYVDEHKLYDYDLPSSAIWRGYRAVFEITAGKIRLKDLGIPEFVKDENGLYWYFKFNSVVNDELIGLINSKYFSGVLVLAEGYLVDFSFFEDEYYPDYKVVEFDKNILRKEVDVKYEEMPTFRDNQFSKYRKTKAYKKNYRACTQMHREQFREYTREGLLDLAETIKESGCDDFIKAFLFRNPSYNKIL